MIDYVNDPDVQDLVNTIEQTQKAVDEAMEAASQAVEKEWNSSVFKKYYDRLLRERVDKIKQTVKEQKERLEKLAEEAYADVADIVSEEIIDCE